MAVAVRHAVAVLPFLSRDAEFAHLANFVNGSIRLGAADIRAMRSLTMEFVPAWAI